MKKFWNWIRNDDGERVLRLEGPIDEDSFWGDEVTPKAFRDELEAEEGDVTVWVNSPGGNVFAASEIYTMLCDHKGKITVKIDAIAASAASVIAMAGDRVLMSPVAMLMIHDPMTIAMGNAKDMEKAISTLNEVKASIINAYQRKTGLSRNKISQLMEDETWMNAKKAVELGFADEILFAKQPEPEKKEEETDGKEKGGKEIEASWQPYSTRIMGRTILNRLVCAAEGAESSDEDPSGEADVEPAEKGMTDLIADAPAKEAEDKAAGQGKTPKKKEAGSEGNPDEDDAPDDPDEDDPDDSDDGPDEGGEPEKPKKDEGAPAKDSAPTIGMDGKTEDGAMPFELLMKQLEFLR